jgi:glycosyltransferase involved in cell wall biosynthesis/O-antigen/teichoic acid export membrane protein
MTALRLDNQHPARTPAEPEKNLQRGIGWLALSAVSVGALNYVYALCLAWLLPAASYAQFAGGQTLLLIAGVVAGASISWLVAQGVARAGADATLRRRVLCLALVVAATLGPTVGVVAAMITGEFASLGEQLALGVTATALFFSAIVLGFLQGCQRFLFMAGLLACDAIVKVVVGLALVLLGAGPAGALAAGSAGAALTIGMGMRLVRSEVRPFEVTWRDRDLWRQASLLALTQTAAAVFVNLDVLLASIMYGSHSDLAQYQVGAMLGRIPLILAVALATAAFPSLSSPDGSFADGVRTSTDVFIGTSLPIAVVIGTMPAPIFQLFFPDHYAGVPPLLPFTTASGILISVAYLAAIALQANRRFLAAGSSLALCLALQGAAVVAGLAVDGLHGVAVATVIGSCGAAAIMLSQFRRTWWRSARPTPATAATALSATGLIIVRHQLGVWCFAAAAVLAMAAWKLIQPHLPGRRDQLQETDSSSGRQSEASRVSDSRKVEPVRILHLAFDDHRHAMSGGGAVRSREINRRLALKHDITVVTINYKGARKRIEDGVRYVPAGINAGYFGRIITYFMALPLVLLRHPSDLVVEDFAPPISSALVPLWTGRPVIGVVQWLFARQKSKQYKLPFFIVERLGVRSHKRLIAVSSEIADRLRALNPTATVEVITNGVQLDDADADISKTTDIVFLGRIEIQHKGLDLLLEAFKQVSAQTEARLLIAGDGPDTKRLLRLRAQLGLEDRVVMRGRVEGHEKRRLLAAAAVVCVPSRYEVYPLVPLEALAAGTPVLTFDIPAMRTLFGAECGEQVPAFDVEAYATALRGFVESPGRCRAMGQAGQQFARQFDWDAIADKQEGVYLDVAMRPDGAAATRR